MGERQGKEKASPLRGGCTIVPLWACQVSGRGVEDGHLLAQASVVTARGGWSGENVNFKRLFYVYMSARMCAM